MRLPNAKHAVIEDSKISQYMLSEGHEDGRGKAVFFKSFGFSPLEPDVFRQALLELARSADDAIVQPSPHGMKYIIVGPIRAPNGNSPVVKTVWLIDNDATRPRLITAFPGKRLST
jgi:hypothetical protein